MSDNYLLSLFKDAISYRQAKFPYGEWTEEESQLIAVSLDPSKEYEILTKRRHGVKDIVDNTKPIDIVENGLCLEIKSFPNPLKSFGVINMGAQTMRVLHDVTEECISEISERRGWTGQSLRDLLKAMRLHENNFRSAQELLTDEEFENFMNAAKLSRCTSAQGIVLCAPFGSLLIEKEDFDEAFRFTKISRDKAKFVLQEKFFEIKYDLA